MELQIHTEVAGCFIPLGIPTRRWVSELGFVTLSEHVTRLRRVSVSEGGRHRGIECHRDNRQEF